MIHMVLVLDYGDPYDGYILERGSTSNYYPNHPLRYILRVFKNPFRHLKDPFLGDLARMIIKYGNGFILQLETRISAPFDILKGIYLTICPLENLEGYTIKYRIIFKHSNLREKTIKFTKKGS